MQTLYLCPIREEFSYFFPVSTLECFNCILQCFILFRCPATLSSPNWPTCSPQTGDGIRRARHRRRPRPSSTTRAAAIRHRRARRRQGLPVLDASLLHALRHRHHHLLITAAPNLADPRSSGCGSNWGSGRRIDRQRRGGGRWREASEGGGGLETLEGV
uniref:Uncharacterized protein n=1 Tax=Arundo donax TaxID=35708 RepID=A0A0A9GDU3_ARUDO